MTREQVLSKIRKLLAMAADTSSPHEAAIAAGQARKLMDNFQVTEFDLKTTEPEDFGTAFQVGPDELWLARLGLAMARLNDCVATMKRNEHGLVQMEFAGYLVDAVTAKELYLYCMAQGMRQAAKRRGRKADYLLGFATGIAQQVREILRERDQIKTSNGTALVVAKRSLVEQRFGVQKVSRHSANARDSAAYSAGVNAGKATGLHRQVSGVGQRRLTN